MNGKTMQRHPFDMESAIQSATEELISKMNEKFHLNVETQKIGDTMLRYVFSVMARRGWSYRLDTSTDVKGSRINLTATLDWYLHGEKMKQEDFDEAVRQIVREANDHDTSQE